MSWNLDLDTSWEKSIWGKYMASMLPMSLVAVDPYLDFILSLSDPYIAVNRSEEFVLLFLAGNEKEDDK